MPMFLEYSEKYFDGHVTHTGEICIRRVDLHDSSNGRDAVYIVRVVSHINNGSKMHTVMTYWGRRGKTLLSKNLGTYGHQPTAFNVANEVVIKKTKKNYDKIYDGNPTSNNMTTYIPNLPSNITDVPLLTEYDNIVMPTGFLGDKVAFELLAPNNDWVFIVMENYQWFVYGQNRNLITSYDISPSIDRDEFKLYHHYVFLAYRNTSTNHFSIFDILDGQLANPPLFNAQKRPWYIRRVMLTQIFNDIYHSNIDIYDTALRFSLSDYTTDEKGKTYLWNNTPQDRLLVIRGIDEKLYTSLLYKKG